MTDRNVHLSTFIAALMAQQLHLFEHTIKAAYEAGATREDLLRAVEIARSLTELPSSVAALAYAGVYAWAWMVTRLAEHQGNVVGLDGAESLRSSHSRPRKTP